MSITPEDALELTPEEVDMALDLEKRIDGAIKDRFSSRNSKIRIDEDAIGINMVGYHQELLAE